MKEVWRGKRNIFEELQYFNGEGLITAGEHLQFYLFDSVNGSLLIGRRRRKLQLGGIL